MAAHQARSFLKYNKLNLSTGLSKQQLECLNYLATGLSIKKISQKLNLSERTVEHYLEAVKEKLDCGSRAELIWKSLALGLITSLE